MENDSSLSTSFDFNSQAGVMSLLASIRSSTLTPAQKNELRDLVFLYANGGGDVSVRIALEQKLASYNIKPVAIKVVVAPEPEVVLEFGSSRPAPSFSTPAIPLSVITDVVPTTTSVPQVTAINPITPTVPVPDTEVTAAPSQPTPVVIAAPTPTPAQPVIKSAPAMPIATNVNPNSYLERIREIKSDVNSKVGNPVNLVDINNEVGREYMNALLDAMKRLSGGAAGQIDVAMQRLETAYLAVGVAVANHAKASAALVESPTPAPAPVPTLTPAPLPTPLQITVPLAAAPVVPNPVPTIALEPDFIPAPPDILTVKEVPVPSQIPVAEPYPAIVTDGASGFDSTAVTAQSPVQASIIANSVLSEQKIFTPQDLPLASSITTSATGDPLLTKEIDDGLEQLLSDWSLFKKSGLFGSGPKGREHPLFKKLAELQIPLLLAGRFEGSTQEIKQSITDYMNGWRYEQGIIYEQGETFEHYLRRVIKKILDLQKKRRSA